MRRWIFKGLVVLAAVAGFLAGVIVLAHLAFEQLRHHDRYIVPFSDIECTPPPGMERGAFLDEVQYESGLPGRLSLLDGDLAKRLASGFQRHPWVAKVAKVELAPPNLIRVHLVFRRPVLAVKAGKGLRAVDGQGTLLPKEAATKGLPLYPGTAKPPTGPAGALWGDPAVEAAAKALSQ